ncbi:major facilitator superfamily MFS_1 [Candidatus Moduliflexus flocculans]|uniref:Major facilitator superfamily MFS_1 n=1 Tax=Candidatus Moduliflexus flocculans TaxID=1499966 RepID=A0A081BLI6_9BACT|nr:major facilitator superfamily MFS_1 [Candidatus Moduliflexus flocculans]
MSMPFKQFQWKQSIAALQYPNYRLWFCGQLVSLFGTWMQTTAQAYLIFQMTNSPTYLGYIAFASGLPSWMFMLYAGVIADRLPRRTLLIITQTAMMLLAFALAALTFSGIVQPWHILAFAFVLGVANAFDAPVRQSFTLEMVEREDLTNAIALNGAMFNGSMAVGPALSGLIYAWLGPAWCFTMNGISYIAVIVALWLMRLKPTPKKTEPTSILADMREGIDYAVTSPIVRALTFLISALMLFGIQFMTLLPAWAVHVLGGDETTNGLLQSARGLGAVVGALALAALGRFPYKGRLLTLGSFAFPLALALFSISRSIHSSFVGLTFVGVAFVLMMNLGNALVQVNSPDHLRGRVMGMYSFLLFGLMPIGGLISGFLAEHIGAPLTIVLNAGVCLLVALMTWFVFPALRSAE